MSRASGLRTAWVYEVRDGEWSNPTGVCEHHGNHLSNLTRKRIKGEPWKLLHQLIQCCHRARSVKYGPSLLPAHTYHMAWLVNHGANPISPWFSLLLSCCILERGSSGERGTHKLLGWQVSLERVKQRRWIGRGWRSEGERDKERGEVYFVPLNTAG